MTPFTSHARTTVIFEPGGLGRTGEIARSLNFTRTLLVSDQGMIDAGYVDRALRSLDSAGIQTLTWHDFAENPDSDSLEKGRVHAAPFSADSIVALGGGSSMDAAKGVNFLLTNGGRIHDYWGYGKAARPLLPMLAIPTTTGTGSEAQSYAVISDAATHRKMACGTPTAAVRIALLDPELAASQPRRVLAASGYDAISHAVETFVTTRRTAFSDCYAREAWRLLDENFERALASPGNVEIAGRMQIASYLAGLAIEHSMLGAAHACANPLTQFHGATHGHALAMVVPHVVRFNNSAANGRYAELHPELPLRLEELRAAAQLPRTLADAGVTTGDLTRLSEAAAEQWTGQFNPRRFDAQAAQEIYLCAL